MYMKSRSTRLLVILDNSNIPFYYISYIYVDMLFMNKKNKEIIDSYRDVYTSLWKIVN